MTDQSKRITTYETARGYKLEIMAVSPFLVQDVRASIPEPVKPTYTMILGNGVEQVRDHDESTLTTDEEKAQWADYLERVKATDAKRTMKVSLVLIREGVINLPPEPSDEWKARYQKHGLTLPDDPDELFLKFFQSEIIGSVSDFTNLQVAIMKASGDVPEEVIAQIEDSFRGAMAGYGAKIAQDTRNSLDSQSASRGSRNGSVLGVEESSGVQSATDSGSSSDDSRQESNRKDASMGSVASPRGSKKEG